MELESCKGSQGQKGFLRSQLGRGRPRTPLGFHQVQSLSIALGNIQTGGKQTDLTLRGHRCSLQCGQNPPPHRPPFSEGSAPEPHSGRMWVAQCHQQRSVRQLKAFPWLTKCGSARKLSPRPPLLLASPSSAPLLPQSGILGTPYSQLSPQYQLCSELSAWPQRSRGSWKLQTEKMVH